jgi:hypothetical protein
MLDDIDVALRILSGEQPDTSNAPLDFEDDDFGPWGMSNHHNKKDEEPILPEPLYTAAYGEGQPNPSPSLSQAAALWHSSKDRLYDDEKYLTHGGIAVPLSRDNAQRMRRGGPVLNRLEPEFSSPKSTRQHWMPWAAKDELHDPATGSFSSNISSRDIIGMFVIEDDLDDDLHGFDEDVPTLVRNSALSAKEDELQHSSTVIEASIPHWCINQHKKKQPSNAKRGLAGLFY